MVARAVFMIIFGSEELSYEIVPDWGNLPDSWVFGNVQGVVVDSRDRVYVFNGGEHPIIIFDREGNFLKSWGEGVFGNPHGISIDGENIIYCTDSRDHTIRKFTTDGKLLKTFGTKNQPGEMGAPFNSPTGVAIDQFGYMFVSDGYGNSRVHKFSLEGEIILSWGEHGDGLGQFDTPHDVWVHKDGRVFVTDRENNRIQIFTSDGEYLDHWTDFNRPCSVFIDPEDKVYVAELSSRMSILDIEGKVLARWGGKKSETLGMFIAPHCAWVDSHGDLYVGETLEGKRIQKFSMKS